MLQKVVLLTRNGKRGKQGAFRPSESEKTLAIGAITESLLEICGTLKAGAQ